jgi:hypothetical protein
MRTITKDLRVARVYCGKIVDDQTLPRLPKPVTLGEHKQTLLVPLVGIGEGFALIQRASDGAYTLRVTDKMSGKLHLGGQDLYLDQLPQHLAARPAGTTPTPDGLATTYEVTLTDQDWGLLQFGERLEVIFQFVVPGQAILSATALSGGAGLTAGAIRGLTSVGGAAADDIKIKGVVAKKAARIRNCYERRLLANPKLGGKVIAQWKIQLDGSVKDAKVASSTIGDDEVGRCLVRLLETSKFKTPDGGVCVVEYPFTFVSQ